MTSNANKDSSWSHIPKDKQHDEQLREINKGVYPVTREFEKKVDKVEQKPKAKHNSDPLSEVSKEFRKDILDGGKSAPKDHPNNVFFENSKGEGPKDENKGKRYEKNVYDKQSGTTASDIKEAVSICPTCRQKRPTDTSRINFDDTADKGIWDKTKDIVKEGADIAKTAISSTKEYLSSKF
jgi:hypothetical protein